jgi:quinol monooxygenase YgiN
MSLSRCAACLPGIVAILALAGLTASAIAAEEKENPIIAQVKASIKDPSKPFTLIVRLKVKEDAGDKLEAACAKAIKETRKEKGCLAYELNRSSKTPTQYMMYERWKNVAALEAHLKTDHITSLLKEIGELLDGAPELRILVPAGE